ncbi:MAG: hypothetical protein EON92_14580, partial [Burkholderiales bacterium]
MSSATQSIKPINPNSITTLLSNFIASASTATLDATVIEKAKHHIVDTMAAMLSGTALDVGERAMAALPA